MHTTASLLLNICQQSHAVTKVLKHAAKNKNIYNRDLSDNLIIRESVNLTFCFYLIALYFQSHDIS